MREIATLSPATCQETSLAPLGYSAWVINQSSLLLLLADKAKDYIMFVFSWGNPYISILTKLM
jgi:hypothetical protein